MKVYLKEARKAARNFKARPFQIEYILNTPGEKLSDIATSAELITRQIRREIDRGIVSFYGKEAEHAFNAAESTLREYKEHKGSPRKIDRWTLNNRVILNLQNVVLPEYRNEIERNENSAHEYRKSLREQVDFMNITRNALYSRPVTYAEPY